jgi:hypothetical protein
MAMSDTDAENPKAAETTAAPRLPRDERRARTLIIVGAALTVAGIALSVTDDSFGRYLVVAGIVLSFIALHRFGRLGPEEARAR